MTRKLAVRTLTVVFVLCLAILGALLYRFETERGAEVASDAPPGTAPGSAIGKFSPLDAPRPAPPLSFAEQSGKTVTLAEFRGRPVLVNLWATWCVPCLKEMPSLARLQAQRTGLTILAISEDRRGEELVGPFLEQHDIKGLAIYLDPKSAVAHALGVGGLPTSFLIDRDGKILGELEGGAEWDSSEMAKVLDRYLAAKG
jgi:thiol-disulfide isomerase/thioredoxin